MRGGLKLLNNTSPHIRLSLLNLQCMGFSEKKGKSHTAIYAGSFDPPSAGHLDIIQRGVTLCDKLYIGIAINSAKK